MTQSTETTNIPTNMSDTNENHSDSKIANRRHLIIWGGCAVLVGWITIVINPWLSISLTLTGLILSILGVRIPPGPRRDIGTTAIVAASVLLLIYIMVACLFLFI